LWPGFGENSRVLKWICERIDGSGGARATPIGYVPAYRALDTSGLNIPREVIMKLLSVDSEEWLREIPEIRKFYDQFGERLPSALREQLQALKKRLQLTENQPPTYNKQLLAWVDSIKLLCKPEKVHWCSGKLLHSYNFSQFQELMMNTTKCAID
jgi:GTP-dependent phosphoenolpyruvate carboxykinase